MTTFHKHLLTLLLIITGCHGVKAQTGSPKVATSTQTAGQSYMKEKTVDHPVYLGFLLVDEPTIETMVDLCEYYDLSPEETTDDYTAYRAPDGTLLRFKQSSDPTAGINGNLIEIQTRASSKTLTRILSNLKYEKVSTKSGQALYEHGSRQARNLILCSVSKSSPKILTFRLVENTF